MFTTRVAHSDAPNATLAMDELIAQCPPDQLPAAGIFYVSDMEADFAYCLERLNDAYPGIELIGCTSDGEMTSLEGLHNQSYALMLFHADNISFATGMGYSLREHPKKSIQDALDEATAKLEGEAALGIILPDAFGAFGNGLDHILTEAMPNTVFAGGSAGDDYKIKDTFQFRGREHATDSFAVLLISGDLKLSASVESGFKPIGDLHTVTSAEGAMVFEVDNIPTVKFYEDYIGRPVTNVTDINQFNLAVTDADGYITQSPAAVDTTTGGVVMAGIMPVGTTFRMTEFGREQLITATEQCAERAIKDYPGENPACVLGFSCTSRRLILGTMADREIAILRDKAPADTPILAFFTYGEFGPRAMGKPCRYHSGTFVTLVIGE